MYLFAKSLFKNKTAGLLAAILYLWAPYRFSVMFVSAAMGASFVFAFLPILMWGILLLTQEKKVRHGIGLVAIGFSGVLLSHLMTAISTLPVVVLFSTWGYFQNRNFNFLKNLSLGLILGSALSAFYLLPGIFYKNLTQISTGAFSQLYLQKFVNLSQLIYSKWGYGIFQSSAKEGAISYQVGIAQWLSVVGSISILIFTAVKKRALGTFLLLAFALSVFAMIDASRPIWEIANRLITLDDPARFLLPATFVGSVLAGFVLTSTKQKLRPLVFLIIMFVAIYTNRNHLRVNMYITDIPVSLTVASEITTNSFHEYLPVQADIKFFSEPNDSVIFPKDLDTYDLYQDHTKLSFSVVTEEDTEVSIRQFSFPGLSLWINEEKTDFTTDERGRIKFRLAQGRHNILVKSEDTQIMKTGKFVSLISLLLLIMMVKSRHAKKKA